jgi:GMP synthase-like glutamine amidotransferase
MGAEARGGEGVNKHILIVDCAIHRDIYRPAEHWRALLRGVPSFAVHLPSYEPVPDLGAYTHVVLTGSESSIVEPAPWFEDEIALVRRAVEAGMPVLGSCFGHQMLALALSGARHVRRAAAPELGWIPIEVTAEDPLLEGVPRPFHAFASHFDEVFAPPPPWRVLARSERCPVHLMRYGDAPVYGVQAHPEIDPVEGRALLFGFAEVDSGRASLFERAAAQEPRDDGIVGTLVARFLSRGE